MTTPTSVVLERRSQALYAARTHTTKGTLLSDSSVRELAEAFIELHTAHRALEQAHETQDTALDEALRQRTELAKERDALLHAFPEYADPQAKLEREQLWAKNDELTKERNGLRDELAARDKALRAAEAELEETRRQEEAFRHECIATGDAGEEAIKAAQRWKLAAKTERAARLKAERPEPTPLLMRVAEAVRGACAETADASDEVSRRVASDLRGLDLAAVVAKAVKS